MTSSKMNVAKELKKEEKEFNQLQDIIDQKREFLKKRHLKINKMVKNNEFLNSVKKDYDDYYDYIVKQENEKLEALSTLRNYVNDLTTSMSLTDENIENAKEDEERIIREVDSIKKNIDRIIMRNKFTLDNANRK